MAPVNERRKDFNKHYALKTEYKAYWEPKHMDITDWIFPEGGRFIGNEGVPNDGKRRDDEILNNTATTALDDLKSGMYGGVTSPTEKWFKIRISNPAFKENTEVRAYFDEVTDTILSGFSNSNFYTMAESLYGELGAYGTSAVQIEFDIDTLYNFTAFTMGQYFFDTDHRGRPNFISREEDMRASSVVEKFGEDNVSQRVKQQVINDKSGTEWVKVLHVQKVNTDRDVTKIDNKNMPFESTYYEMAGSENEPPLRASGYESQPFAVPRWSVTGNNTWGTGPGDKALGDVRELQQLESDLLEAIAKQNDVPVVINAGAGDVSLNMGAGGETWVDNVTVQQGKVVEPAYEVQTSIRDLLVAIEKVEARVKSAFFSDLFFLLAASNTTQKTATEIVAAQRENLRRLGPIIERLHPEFLRIVIERCYDIAEKAGRLPPPPTEIAGLDVKIEILSLIAQAQKLTAIGPIEQLVAFSQALAATHPEVIDKINADQIIDEVGGSLGVPAGTINSDEVVFEVRTDRKAELDAQQAAADAQMAVDNAQKLSQTDTGGNNALTAIAGAA